MYKWRHYLLGSEFTIRTDHSSLKNLLGQVIQSPEQQYFLTRLLGFSFKIEYRKGKENAAADALSRLPATELEKELAELKRLTSEMVSNWEELVAKENETNDWILAMKEKVQAEETDSKFSVQNGILYFQELFVLGPTSTLRSW